MGFRVGFLAGCAVGMVAAAKAAQLQRLGVQPSHRLSAPVGSRAGIVSPGLSAEKLRAIGDLAKARVTLVREREVATHNRLAALLSSSLWQPSRRPIVPSPVNGNRHYV